jgi:hypothetical protein
MVEFWLSSFAVMLFGAAGPMCGLTNASKEEDAVGLFNPYGLRLASNQRWYTDIDFRQQIAITLGIPAPSILSEIGILKQLEPMVVHFGKRLPLDRIETMTDVPYWDSSAPSLAS